MKNLEKNDDIEEFNDDDITKSEIIAEKLLRRCHVHDFDSGGILSLITGGMGSGKTSVMLSFANYTLKHFPQEKVFWSNTYYAPIQSLRIGQDKHNILVLKDSNVTFHDRKERLKRIYPKVTEFNDFNDLYDKALPGKLNCVFFGNRHIWMDFIHYLRGAGEWVHVFIDELSELCPAFSSGNLFKQIGKFSIDLKECRKTMLNIHTNSQALPDCDHRVRTKIMLRIFLPGAKSGKESRLSQKALDNLLENPRYGNEGYIESAGRFGRTQFCDIYPPNRKHQWEAHNEI
jgi:hypothetical protein